MRQAVIVTRPWDTLYLALNGGTGNRGSTTGTFQPQLCPTDQRYFVTYIKSPEIARGFFRSSV
jgi:hypothetical protein